MRVILTAKQALVPAHARTLQRLVGILGVVSKNPSNPNFDQCLFESISALLRCVPVIACVLGGAANKGRRFVVAGQPDTLASFEQALFGPFTFIIQNEIERACRALPATPRADARAEYIPYAFQILAQMLDAHAGAVPDAYRALLPFLLVPAPWAQKGSVPGLVRLLRAYLARDARAMAAAGQTANVLAIVQQRLVPSKLNDVWGFELLQAVLRFVPMDVLRPQLRAVLITLFTRLQTSKTDRYVQLFAHFVLYAMAVQVDGLAPDVLIGATEEIQPGLWGMVLANIVIPQMPKMPVKDRKLAVVGMTRMLTESALMVADPAAQSWSVPLCTRSCTNSRPAQAGRVREHGRARAAAAERSRGRRGRRRPRRGAHCDRLRGADRGLPGRVLAPRGRRGRARGPRRVRAGRERVRRAAAARGRRGAPAPARARGRGGPGGRGAVLAGDAWGRGSLSGLCRGC
jgi:exportin-2 (importin alpha re-exporter)